MNKCSNINLGGTQCLYTATENGHVHSGHAHSTLVSVHSQKDHIVTLSRREKENLLQKEKAERFAEIRKGSAKRKLD